LLQLGAGLLISAGLFLLAPLLVLTLFGAQYADSIPLLRLFALIPVLRGATSGLAAILIAMRRQPERTVVQIMTAIISVVGALLVIDRFGLLGVAWVFVATEAINLAGHAYLVAGGRLLRSRTATKEATT
jgi:PST family polysaccharide transporter